MIARHSSLCPCCGKYVQKGRSRIAMLPEALPVQVADWSLNRRGGWYTKHGVYDPSTDFRRRAAVHERCYEAGLAALYGGDA